MVTDPLELIDQWGPEKVVLVSDRRSGMRGVLVIDNTSRGLGKGGTRMSPTLTVSEVARLARTMTWKWAAVDLFHGGAKAGILGDPRAGNKEQVLRAFARALAKEVPSDYVFGLDMGLAEEDAAIFVDELNDRGVSTGLPRGAGRPAVRQARSDRLRRRRGGRCGRGHDRPRPARRAGRHPGLRCRRAGGSDPADRARRRRGGRLDRHRLRLRPRRSRRRRAGRTRRRPR